MWQIMVIGWAVAVFVAVFILYVRDPYANGIHPPLIEPLVQKLRHGLDSVRERLCMYGRHFPGCPVSC